MGSSDTGTGGGGAVDCSIGSIVWVRRRNGSWWPGKILGPDELSASHVMSPRSGTPVKLLGREDASVDWYNLEKSKRVKAFRCGEFDDCIERAEASQGLPPKKREKYARREDAILHALELERQTFEKKYRKIGFPTNGIRNDKLPNDARGQLLMSSENLEMGKGRDLQSEAHLDLKSSHIIPLTDRSIICKSVKVENEFCADDGNSEITPRIRELRDFELQIVPSSLKISPSASPNSSSLKPLSGSGARTHPKNVLDLEDVVGDGGIENLSDKRKRPYEGLGSGDDILSKRRERCLPILQVLENSSKAFGPHPEADGSTVNLTALSEYEQPGTSRRNTSVLHGDLEEDNIGSTEDTETDSCETDSLDSATDEMASLSEGAASIELQPKYPRRSEIQEEPSISSEEVVGLGPENEISRPGYNYDLPASSMGMSKWQLKGKRNTRNLVKKPVAGGGDRKFSWVSMEEINAFEAITNGRDELFSLGKSYGPPRVARYGSVSDRTTQWQQQWDWSNQHVKYWDDLGKYYDPVYVGRGQFGGRGMLIDVDIRVQSSSSYQREHVPMISLRSKLNDQAIVGHPIQIEALENCFTESLIAITDEWCPADTQESSESALAPTWRTARRTANVRFPRPNLSSSAVGNNDISRHHHHQVIESRRGGSSTRKPQKKISLSSTSNQKTRTLSSISLSQPRKSGTSDPKRSGRNEYGMMDGLKQSDSTLPPTTVACIPVKLVFSRLQEELMGRHT